MLSLKKRLKPQPPQFVPKARTKEIIITTRKECLHWLYENSIASGSLISYRNHGNESVYLLFFPCSFLLFWSQYCVLRTDSLYSLPSYETQDMKSENLRLPLIHRFLLFLVFLLDHVNAKNFTG